jgi:chaperonin cofactor prefoldin
MIDEEEGVPYKIGDSFYVLSTEEVTERMEGEKESTGGEISRMEEEIENLKGELEKLKKVLYGKFGTSINLEK